MIEIRRGTRPPRPGRDAQRRENRRQCRIHQTVNCRTLPMAVPVSASVCFLVRPNAVASTGETCVKWIPHRECTVDGFAASAPKIPPHIHGKNGSTMTVPKIRCEAKCLNLLSDTLLRATKVPPAMGRDLPARRQKSSAVCGASPMATRTVSYARRGREDRAC